GPGMSALEPAGPRPGDIESRSRRTGFREASWSPPKRKGAPCWGKSCRKAMPRYSRAVSPERVMPTRGLHSPCLERARIVEARERLVRVVVRPDGACLRIGHLDRVLDVRERAEEDPEVVVDDARVEHFDDELEVVGREKPEGPRIPGQVGRRSAAVSALVGNGPGDLDLEAGIVQAQRERAGRAGGRLCPHLR